MDFSGPPKSGSSHVRGHVFVPYNKQTVLSITACVAAPRCEKRFMTQRPDLILNPSNMAAARRKISPCAGPLLLRSVI